MADGPTNIFQINISSVRERSVGPVISRFVKQQFGHQLSITLFVPQNISVHPHLHSRGTGTVLVQRGRLLKPVSLLVCSCSMFLSMCQWLSIACASARWCFTPNGHNWLRWGSRISPGPSDNLSPVVARWWCSKFLFNLDRMIFAQKIFWRWRMDGTDGVSLAEEAWYIWPSRYWQGMAGGSDCEALHHFISLFISWDWDPANLFSFIKHSDQDHCNISSYSMFLQGLLRQHILFCILRLSQSKSNLSSATKT